MTKVVPSSGGDDGGGGGRDKGAGTGGDGVGAPEDAFEVPTPFHVAQKEKWLVRAEDERDKELEMFR